MKLVRLFLVIGLFSFISEAHAELNDTTLLPRAEQGDACAQKTIGFNYYNSQGGVRQDYQKALEWYLKAANAKCSDEKCEQCKKGAYFSLGNVYSRRLNPRNYKEAFKWYLKAAKNGSPRAYDTVAKYYAAGEVVKQDYEKAYYWYTLGQRRPDNDFITEVRSHLTEQQIKKIDDQNEKLIQELAQKQRNAFADMMDQAHLGFNPKASPEDRANARMAFELGLNHHYYDVRGIKKLIDMGALESSLAPKEGLLFTAIKKNDLELVKLSLENGIDPNAKGSNGSTALHISTRPEDIDIALELIKEGADVNAANNRGATPLIKAAEYGNLTLVKALIAAGADLNAVENNDGYGGLRDALYYAFRHGYQDIVTILFDAGARGGKGQSRVISSKRNCSRDIKICPNGEKISMKLPDCEYEVCPETQKDKEEQKIVPGTFSEIDTKLSKDAIKSLTSKNAEEKDKVIEEIKQNPGNYTPAVLQTTSRVLFSRIEDEEAAFWYLAADLRKRQDIKACKDKTADKKLLSYYNLVKQMKPFAQLNPEIIEPLFERVVEWDKSTPRNYDVRWVNLGGGMGTNKLTDPIPEGLCKTEDEIEKAREFTRTSYAAIFRGANKSFDYRADPRKRMKLAEKPPEDDVTKTVAYIKRIKAAFSTFQDMYGAIPGDMADASERISGCDNYNGNGDKFVGLSELKEVKLFKDERHLFWVHLKKAGLLSGFDADSKERAWGKAFPSSPMGGGFHVYNHESMGVLPKAVAPVNAEQGIYLILTNDLKGDLSSENSHFLTAEQAERIDRKLDDGAPLSGRVIAVGDDKCLENETGVIENKYNKEMQDQCLSLFVRIMNVGSAKARRIDKNWPPKK